MELIRIANMEEGAAPLQNRLVSELEAGKNVVWIVTGGSSIPLSVTVMRNIPDDLTKRLSIYWTDERYGDIGHPDSNALLLEQAGFDPKQARMVNVLAKYALSVAAAFEAADIVIALIGMGPDGHVCGILPGSPAVESDKLVVGYVTETFTRITLTPKALKQYVDAAYVFAFGEAKKEALANLLVEKPLSEQPAQILKQLPEAYVYNDQISTEKPD
jgi:6-phosphogluconolactonase/glucosamine-6-phosphate isomerase/deaminase